MAMLVYQRVSPLVSRLEKYGQVAMPGAPYLESSFKGIRVSNHVQMLQHVGVSKNRGTPKMDGFLNNERPY